MKGMERSFIENKKTIHSLREVELEMKRNLIMSSVGRELKDKILDFKANSRSNP